MEIKQRPRLVFTNGLIIESDKETGEKLVSWPAIESFAEHFLQWTPEEIREDLDKYGY